MLDLNNIIDSHAHYDDQHFGCDAHDVLSSLPQKGIRAVINVGCDESSSAQIADNIVDKYPFLFGSVGVHPHYAQEVSGNYLDCLKKLAQNPKIVAVGEIGLDYHYDNSPRLAQQEVFEQQLILASQLELPVIIHSREATHDTLEMLRKYRPKGVVHCFSSSKETAKKIVDLGMCLGFTGVVTFKNARKVVEALEIVPLEHILLETDCPYLAPVPFRSQRCDSSMIKYTAEKIAQIKNIPTQQLVDIATQNTIKLFNLPL